MKKNYIQTFRISVFIVILGLFFIGVGVNIDSAFISTFTISAGNIAIIGAMILFAWDFKINSSYIEYAENSMRKDFMDEARQAHKSLHGIDGTSPNQATDFKAQLREYWPQYLAEDEIECMLVEIQNEFKN